MIRLNQLRRRRLIKRTVTSATPAHKLPWRSTSYRVVAIHLVEVNGRRLG